MVRRIRRSFDCALRASLRMTMLLVHGYVEDFG
jgi:hypothetical protein